jgi:hypothetical protein
VARGSNGGVTGFNAIEDWGEVKRGIRGGDGGRVRNDSGGIRGCSYSARGGRRRRGEITTVDRCGEGDGADRWAPHGSDVRERMRLCRSVQGRREYTFRQIRQRGLGRGGRAGSRRPAGRSETEWAGLGRMGRNPKKIHFRIKIKFLNIPRLWKFAQGDLGGILT